MKVKIVENIEESDCELCGWYEYGTIDVYVDDKLVKTLTHDTHMGGDTSIEDPQEYLKSILQVIDIEVEFV